MIVIHGILSADIFVRGLHLLWSAFPNHRGKAFSDQFDGHWADASGECEIGNVCPCQGQTYTQHTAKGYSGSDPVI